MNILINNCRLLDIFIVVNIGVGNNNVNSNECYFIEYTGSLHILNKVRTQKVPISSHKFPRTTHARAPSHEPRATSHEP